MNRWVIVVYLAEKENDDAAGKMLRSSFFFPGCDAGRTARHPDLQRFAGRDGIGPSDTVRPNGCSADCDVFLGKKGYCSTGNTDVPRRVDHEGKKRTGRSQTSFSLARRKGFGTFPRKEKEQNTKSVPIKQIRLERRPVFSVLALHFFPFFV